MYYRSKSLALSRAKEFASLSGVAYSVFETLEGAFEVMAAGLKPLGMPYRLVETILPSGAFSS